MKSHWFSRMGKMLRRMVTYGVIGDSQLRHFETEKGLGAMPMKTRGKW